MALRIQTLRHQAPRHQAPRVRTSHNDVLHGSLIMLGALIALGLSSACAGDDAGTSPCDEAMSQIFEANINGEAYVGCDVAWTQKSFDGGRGAEVLQIYTSELRRTRDDGADGGVRNLMLQVTVNQDAFARDAFRGVHPLAGHYQEARDEMFETALTEGRVDVDPPSDASHVTGTFSGTTVFGPETVRITEGYFDVALDNAHRRPDEM